MSKLKIKVKDMEEYVTKYNPFGCINEAGELQVFATYKEAYLYVMEVLDKYYPRGYVDIVLLLNQLTGVPFNACLEVFRDMSTIWGKQHEKMIIYPWPPIEKEGDSNAGKKDLELLMRSLHCVSETKFDSVMFISAMVQMKINKMQASHEK